RKELVAKIQAKIDALNADFIIEECTKFSVPVSMIQNLENVFKNKYSKKYILNYPKNEQNKSSSVVKTFVVCFG
ncbi:MAG: hypothetical protein KBA06_04175, partial [Saprospiraceae bacterium]|nr:hypothetical protein [Saprospiraceae bacterium]